MPFAGKGSANPDDLRIRTVPLARAGSILYSG